MYTHGTWDGCGSGEPTQPDLNMALFDSPLSELNESYGEEINLSTEFLEGDFHFQQGVGYPALSDSVDSLDVNAQLAACFDFNDPLLYPDADLAFGLDMMDFDAFTPDLMWPGQVAGSAVSSVDASPFSRLSDFSSLTSATSPASPGEAAGAATHPHRCTTDGCSKTFRKESQLKQHQRVHKKSLVCPICRAEQQTEHKFAQVRDLERHLQARHRDVAERANVRSETRECPAPGCEHRGRRDNVSRHYESKHGGKLKWRKGVPSVI